MIGGYPEEHELATIRTWHYEDFPALMEYIRERWVYADEEGYWQRQGDTYQLLTGGWSGNEDIITELTQNTVFWAFCWRSSECGGRYTFEVRRL